VNPVHISTPCTFHFKFILTPTGQPTTVMWSLLFRFPDYHTVLICHFPHACCTRRLSHSPSSDHPNNTKMTAFWDVVPCSLVEVDRFFRDPYCLHHRCYETTLHNIPEGCRHIHRRENLKSHILIIQFEPRIPVLERPRTVHVQNSVKIKNFLDIISRPN
jgi:hypothetical protein